MFRTDSLSESNTSSSRTSATLKHAHACTHLLVKAIFSMTNTWWRIPVLFSPPYLRCLLSSWRESYERCFDLCSPAPSRSRCWSAAWTSRCPRSSRPGCPPHSCCVCAWGRTTPEPKTHCSEAGGTPLSVAARNHHFCRPYCTCRGTETRQSHKSISSFSVSTSIKCRLVL